MGTGYLVVQVTTASSAIPLEDATVTVTKDEENSTETLYVLRTGRDGRTVRVALEAPPRAGSLIYGGKAFATYNIRAQADGYVRAEYNHVPIFDGITAIQQANLIPTPENGYPDDFSLDRPRIYGTGNEQGV
jgi:5-hydroxyisourate hydrolase-like protein (transthyretin family)